MKIARDRGPCTRWCRITDVFALTIDWIDVFEALQGMKAAVGALEELVASRSYIFPRGRRVEIIYHLQNYISYVPMWVYSSSFYSTLHILPYSLHDNLYRTPRLYFVVLDVCENSRVIGFPQSPFLSILKNFRLQPPFERTNSGAPAVFDGIVFLTRKVAGAKT